MTNKISIDAQNKKRVHLDIIGDNNTIIVKDLSGNQFNAYLIGGDPQSDIAVLLIALTKNQKRDLVIPVPT